jgi:hypothetical protein
VAHPDIAIKANAAAAVGLDALVVLSKNREQAGKKIPKKASNFGFYPGPIINNSYSYYAVQKLLNGLDSSPGSSRGGL